MTEDDAYEFHLRITPPYDEDEGLVVDMSLEFARGYEPYDREELIGIVAKELALWVVNHEKQQTGRLGDLDKRAREFN